MAVFEAIKLAKTFMIQNAKGSELYGKNFCMGYYQE